MTALPSAPSSTDTPCREYYYTIGVHRGTGAGIPVSPGAGFRSKLANRAKTTREDSERR
jgi:hypothetical protein